MLNKYTLNFLYPEQSESYIRNNSPKIIREHLNFTLYALTFALVCVIQFAMAKSIILAVFAGLSIILILFLQHFLSKKPYYINFIVTFYQFFVLLIVTINYFLDQNEAASQTFAWSYGYQVAFMNFCLYLQATELIWSSIVLFLVIAIHYITFPYDPIYTYTHIFSFFFTFLCMIAVKYTYEKRKKEEFFYSYQQEQWDCIIRKSISNTMILIRYDEKQDQLRLVKQSIQSQHINKIENCYDLRQFLRNLFLINLTKTMKIKEQGKNLEQQIRDILILQSEKYIMKPFDKKYVIDQVNKIIYKFKLSKFVLDNELQCLLILDKIQISENQSQEMQMSLFTELTSYVAKEIRCQFNMQISKNFSKYKKLMKDNYYIQTTLFFVQLIMKNFIAVEKQIITYQDLAVQLNKIFDKNIKLYLDFNIYQQSKYLISIILTCCKLVEYVCGKLPECIIRIQRNEEQQIEMSLCYSIAVQLHEHSIFQLLQANWIGSNRRQFNSQQLYECCVERLCLLTQQYNLPKLLLFDICALQILLSQITLFNHMKIKCDQQQLKLICIFESFDGI